MSYVGAGLAILQPKSRLLCEKKIHIPKIISGPEKAQRNKDALF
jgi:hypothetical protein